MPSETADCPYCEALHNAHVKFMEKSLAKNYGQVDQETYDALKQKLETTKAAGPPTETMEEHYEHWFAEGKFKRRYNCLCEKCGWGFQADTVEEECILVVDFDQLTEEED